MFGLGPNREILRIHLQCWLFLAGTHAARSRHSRRLRAIEIGDREIVGARTPGAARHGDDGLRSFLMVRRRVSAVSNHEAAMPHPSRRGQWPLLRTRREKALLIVAELGK